jgi:hypothetical protein
VTFLFNQTGPAGPSVPLAPRALVGTKNDLNKDRTILYCVYDVIYFSIKPSTRQGGAVLSHSTVSPIHLAS